MHIAFIFLSNGGQKMPLLFDHVKDQELQTICMLAITGVIQMLVNNVLTGTLVFNRCW